jgi:hypothetical protein
VGSSPSGATTRKVVKRDALADLERTLVD